MSKVEDGRVTAIVLKDTREYRDWLREVSARTYMPIATLIRVSVAEFATRHGCPPPPAFQTRAGFHPGAGGVEEEEVIPSAQPSRPGEGSRPTAPSSPSQGGNGSGGPPRLRFGGKTTAETVLELRAARPTLTQAEIAKLLKVDPAQVSRIMSRAKREEAEKESKARLEEIPE